MKEAWWCSLHRSPADDPVDSVALRTCLLRAEARGFCSFEGWVRPTNDSRPVPRIAYEAYAPLAVTEGQTILDEALARFHITDVVATHRSGYLRVGDIAAWIGVVAPHRNAAFSGCRSGSRSTMPMGRSAGSPVIAMNNSSRVGPILALARP